VYANLFNLINARDMFGELVGPFFSMFTNNSFLAVVVVCSGLQGIFTQLGGVFFHVVGLSGYHWGLSIGFAALTILMGFPVRFICSFLPAAREKDYADYYQKWFYASVSKKA